MSLQYSEDQINEIEIGLEKGLDTTLYEDPAFLAMHMHEIRIGLEKGLKVEYYADPGFDWMQMREIRMGLESAIDVSGYADKSIPYDIMREERKAIQYGVDISDYKGGRRGKSAPIMRQLRKGRIGGVELMPFIQEGYDPEQLQEIRIALEKGIDIIPYLDINYRGSAIDEIRKGLESGIDVSIYTDAEYNWRQMHEIRLGLQKRLEVDKYKNKYYSHQQMREIRLGLEAGLNVDEYRQMRFSATDMRRKRLELIELLDSAMKAGQSVLDEIEDIVRKQQDKEAGIEPITLTITRDKKEAFVTVREGYDVTEQDVLNLVWNAGIRKGIKRDAMKAIEKGERGDDGQVLVAKGEDSTNGEDGWYEFFFRTDLDGKPKILPDGTVDYNNIEWFDLVTEEQKVAEYHPATKGSDGFDVFGNVVPGRNGIEQPLLTGKGFKVSKDGLIYTSEEDGLVVLRDGRRLEISSVLEVEEVNSSTGFVVYKGNVHVRGDVGTGGVINCGGDVIVDGFVEGGNITAEGDIILKHGMNGNGRGVVRAGKNVTAKFFENADVFAGDTIFLDYATNSTLYAENYVEVQRQRGAIVGGAITGLNGMTIYSAGNKMGAKTKLVAGAPKSVSSKRMELLDKIKTHKEQLKVLRNAEADFHKKYPLTVLTQMEVFTKIENAIYTRELDVESANNELSDFVEKEKEYAKAKIIVKGDLFDGVDIEISGRHWISSGMTRVTLKLVNDEHGEHVIAYND